MRPTKQYAPTAGTLALLGLLVVGLSACGRQAEQEPETGSTSRAGLAVWNAPRPVPDLRFVDGDGQSRRLADFKGKVVLLNLWATWCGPCRKEMPTLDRLQGQLGGPDFEVVALSLDQAGAQAVREFYREVGLQHLQLYIDRSAQAAITLDAIGIPTTLLLDRQGREIGRKLGEAEWDSADVVAYLREVIERGESGD